MEINNILQGLIYSFNEDPVRDSIVNTSLKDFKKCHHPVLWKGTYTLNENKEYFHEYRRWKLMKNKKYLFTVSYTYQTTRIHFVAFILDVSRKELICFDPGYNLYIQGTQKIIPIIVNELTNSNVIHKKVIFKTVCESPFGVQYNGKAGCRSILCADAFCQTWTLFFLQRYLECNCSPDFFKTWCKIPPQHREFYLIQSFIIPTVMSNPIVSRQHKAHLPQLHEYILRQYWIKQS